MKMKTVCVRQSKIAYKIVIQDHVELNIGTFNGCTTQLDELKIEMRLNSTERVLSKKQIGSIPRNACGASGDIIIWFLMCMIEK